jgi:chemotaxis protein histidine kinase CheA
MLRSIRNSSWINTKF